MKTIKSILVIAIIAILGSCSKDDALVTNNSQVETTAIFPEQNPLAGFLAASGFDQVTSNSINFNASEFGL